MANFNFEFYDQWNFTQKIIPINLDILFDIYEKHVIYMP